MSLAAVRQPGYLYGAVLVFSGGVVLSFAGLLFRMVESASDWQIMIYRSGSAALSVLLFVAIRHRGRLIAACRAIGLPGLVAALFMGFGFTCYTLSITNTTVANALFLASTAPVFAALLGWLVLREAVRRASALAAVVALMGVALMVYDGFTTGGLFGNLTGIGAAIGIAGYAVMIRRRAVDMAPALAFGAALSALIALGAAETPAISGHDLVLGLILGAVQLSLGFVLLTYGARYVPAAEVVLIALSEVMLGPIWVWLAVGEVPTALALGGGAFILAAVAGLSLHGLRSAAFANARATPTEPAVLYLTDRVAPAEAPVAPTPTAAPAPRPAPPSRPVSTPIAAAPTRPTAHCAGYRGHPAASARARIRTLGRGQHAAARGTARPARDRSHGPGSRTRGRPARLSVLRHRDRCIGTPLAGAWSDPLKVVQIC